eukprot:scaffold360560_cov31-Attheya_sp.AAC.1
MGNRLSEIAGNRIGSGRYAPLPSPVSLISLSLLPIIASMKVIYDLARSRYSGYSGWLPATNGSSSSGRVHFHHGQLLWWGPRTKLS